MRAIMMHGPWREDKGQAATVLTVLIALILLATTIIIQQGQRRINHARVRIAAESGAMFLNSQVGSYAHYLSEKYLKGKKKTKCKRNWLGFVMIVVAIILTAITMGSFTPIAGAIIGGAIGYAAGGSQGMMIGMMVGAAIGAAVAGAGGAGGAGGASVEGTGTGAGVEGTGAGVEGTVVEGTGTVAEGTGAGDSVVSGYLAAASMALDGAYDQFVLYPRALDKVGKMFKKFGKDTKGYYIYQTLYYMAGQLIDDPKFQDAFKDAIDEYLRGSAHLSALNISADEDVKYFFSHYMENFYNDIGTYNSLISSLQPLFNEANNFLNDNGSTPVYMPYVHLPNYYSTCFSLDEGGRIKTDKFIGSLLYENWARAILADQCSNASFQTFYRDTNSMMVGEHSSLAYSIMASNPCMIKPVWYCQPPCNESSDVSSDDEEKTDESDINADLSWHAELSKVSDAIAQVRLNINTLYDRVRQVFLSLPPAPTNPMVVDPYADTRSDAASLMSRLSNTGDQLKDMKDIIDGFLIHIEDTFQPILCKEVLSMGSSADYSFDYSWNDAIGRPHHVYVGVWNFNLPKIKPKKCFLGSRLKLKHYKGDLHVIAERDGYRVRMKSHYHYKGTEHWSISAE